MKITLASNSTIRQQLFRSAGIAFEVKVSAFNEDAQKDMMIDRGDSVELIVDALADGKAKHVAKERAGLVIGCDQVLELEGQLISKPRSREECRSQLQDLRGKEHRLLSAAVIYENQSRVWSHVGIVRLKMRDYSEAYLEDYLQRNWYSVQASVGGYKLEEEGVRLFSEIAGDYFTVLGMPLMEVLGYLGQRGVIDG